MGRHIRVRGVRRKEIDEDKLALAFLMLAKVMRGDDEQERGEGGSHLGSSAEPEASS
jgi:hypothetical protein